MTLFNTVRAWFTRKPRTAMAQKLPPKLPAAPYRGHVPPHPLPPRAAHSFTQTTAPPTASSDASISDALLMNALFSPSYHHTDDCAAPAARYSSGGGGDFGGGGASASWSDSSGSGSSDSSSSSSSSSSD